MDFGLGHTHVTRLRGCCKLKLDENRGLPGYGMSKPDTGWWEGVLPGGSCRALPQSAGNGRRFRLPVRPCAVCPQVGDGILPCWLPIVARHRDTPFTEEQRNWQLLRRGRYLGAWVRWGATGVIVGVESWWRCAYAWSWGG